VRSETESATLHNGRYSSTEAEAEFMDLLCYRYYGGGRATVCYAALHDHGYLLMAV
jgi:hypothetical protein